MPFFAGLALACNVIASLGSGALAVLSTRELWLFTIGFAILAILTSPLGRSTTEPISDRILDSIGRWKARRRLTSG
jgi:hypothetical protein